MLRTEAGGFLGVQPNTLQTQLLGLRYKSLLAQGIMGPLLQAQRGRFLILCPCIIHPTWTKPLPPPEEGSHSKLCAPPLRGGAAELVNVLEGVFSSVSPPVGLELAQSHVAFVILACFGEPLTFFSSLPFSFLCYFFPFTSLPHSPSPYLPLPFLKYATHTSVSIHTCKNAHDSSRPGHLSFCLLWG